jgi:uncharacterized protein (TIGR00730 family)
MKEKSMSTRRRTPPIPPPQENHRAILESPSYVLAEEDAALLKRDEFRGVRMLLEYRKPELAFLENHIRSTIVVFGGTRIIEERKARKQVMNLRDQLAKNPESKELQRDLGIAERVLAKSRYYEEARELGQRVSRACQRADRRELVVITGGGPGIMEAANRGAYEVGAKSIGLNITLPLEQEPNAFITPDLCFQFHYFALRKLHFLMRAKALVAFPGGFGTLDELFDALTLLQTRKIDPLPVILVGRGFWDRVVDFAVLVEEGTIQREDLELFRYAENAEEIWRVICSFHRMDPDRPRP